MKLAVQGHWLNYSLFQVVFLILIFFPGNLKIAYFRHCLLANAKDNKSNLIFYYYCQLTKLEEKGLVKCAQYWSENSSLSIKDIVITPTEIHDFPDHTVRSFHVTRMGQAVERLVKQFHFISWPDFGVPEDPSALLSFMRKVNNWKRSTQCSTVCTILF